MSRRCPKTWTCPLLAAFLLGLFIGCARQSPPPAATTPIDAAGLEAAVAAHRGQVVLVDFWATWCGPCAELFPHTVELQRRFKDRGLTVIAVSLDAPDAAAAVGRFLARHGVADAPNFRHLSRYGVGPEAFEALKIDDGALPHLRLYDRQGRLQRVFSGSGRTIDAGEVDRAVEELLAAGDD